MTQTRMPNVERAIRRGRYVVLIGAIAGLILVWSWVPISYNKGYSWKDLVYPMMAVGAASYWLGGWFGKVVTSKGPLYIATAPLIGVLCALAGAVGVVLNNALGTHGEYDHSSASEFLYAYGVKPIHAVIIWGSIPAALIGLICGAVIFIATRLDNPRTNSSTPTLNA